MGKSSSTHTQPLRTWVDLDERRRFAALGTLYGNLADGPTCWIDPSPAPPVTDLAAGPAAAIELDARYHDNLDRLEVEMMGRPAVELPLVHRFTPGLYIREISMPAGTLLTSKIHKTEHPYTISKGRVSVLTENDGWVELRAPHTGITKPGTRRVLLIHEDTIWTTYHPTNETDLEVLEELLIERHDEHRAGLTQPTEIPVLEGA